MVKTFRHNQFGLWKKFPFHFQPGRFEVDRFPVHTHDFSELVIILGGSSIHVAGNREYPISAGDVFLVQGRWTHGFKKAQDLALVNIMYDPHLLEPAKEQLAKIPGYHALFVLEPRYRPKHDFQSRLRLSAQELFPVRELLMKMEKEYSGRACGYEAMVLSLFFQLATYLARRYSGIQTPSGKSLLRVGEVISSIETRYQEAVTLNFLARSAHLSVNHLLRLFKEATGQSPIDYLVRFRINKARELVAGTDLAITEIGFRTGFSDSNYFTRQFKKVTGFSPREYRKRQSSFLH
jgi:AraC-like DNA-binding protein